MAARVGSPCLDETSLRARSKCRGTCALELQEGFARKGNTVHRNKIKETKIFFHGSKTDKLTTSTYTHHLLSLHCCFNIGKQNWLKKRQEFGSGAIFPNLRTSEISQQLRGIFSDISLPADFCRRCWLPGLELTLSCFKAWFSCKFCQHLLEIPRFVLPLGLNFQKSICAWYTSFLPPNQKVNPPPII